MNHFCFTIESVGFYWQLMKFLSVDIDLWWSDPRLNKPQRTIFFLQIAVDPNYFPNNMGFCWEKATRLFTSFVYLTNVARFENRQQYYIMLLSGRLILNFFLQPTLLKVLYSQNRISLLKQFPLMFFNSLSLSKPTI